MVEDRTVGMRKVIHLKLTARELGFSLTEAMPQADVK